MNEHDFLKMKSRVDRETAANTTEHSSFKRRLDALEKADRERTEMYLAIQRQGDAVESLGTKMDGIATSVAGVEKRLDVIEREPAENAKKLKYEVIKYIVLAVLGVVVGYFIKG